MAILDEESATVVILGPADFIREASSALKKVELARPKRIQVLATIVEFELKDSAITGTSVERLRTLAGKSWREVDVMSGTTKAGQWMVTLRGGADGSSSLRPGESGTEIEVSPTMSIDERTVDAEIKFTQHGSEEISGKYAVNLADGLPLLVTSWKSSRSKSLYRALMIKADLVTDEGVPIREAFKAKLNGEPSPSAR